MSKTDYSCAEVIKQILAEQHLTQTAFGKRLGVTQPAVSLWIKGGSIDFKIMKRISQEFNIPLAKFAGDEQTVSTVSRIPVISWVQAGTWTQVPDMDSVTEYRDVPSSTPSDWFAIKVNGDSMTRPSGGDSILDGDIVIVKPYKGEPLDSLNHRIIIALHDGATVMKELRFDGSKPYLSAWNPDPAYGPIKDLEQVLIIGIVTQSIRDR